MSEPMSSSDMALAKRRKKLSIEEEELLEEVNSRKAVLFSRPASTAAAQHVLTMPHRHCYVEINNNSGCYTLSNPRVFTESGCCEDPLPPMLGPCSTSSAMFNKTTGAATGAVGLFTYDLFNADLNDYNHILAVMYSVPYDRILYSNWFAVGIFDRGNSCDYNLYEIMYKGSETNFVRAKADGSSISYEGDYVIVGASMSDSGEAVLKVDINDIGM